MIGFMPTQPNVFNYLPERLRQFTLKVECSLEGVYRSYTVDVIDAYHEGDAIYFRGKRIDFYAYTNLYRITLIDNFGNPVRSKKLNTDVYWGSTISPQFVLRK